MKCFLRVPQLFYSFPSDQASKGNSQKVVYEASYPSSGTKFMHRASRLYVCNV